VLRWCCAGAAVLWCWCCFALVLVPGAALLWCWCCSALVLVLLVLF
jgi:hypothetical protein